jgi:hypothetical protein
MVISIGVKKHFVCKILVKIVLHIFYILCIHSECLVNHLLKN